MFVLVAIGVVVVGIVANQLLSSRGDAETQRACISTVRRNVTTPMWTPTDTRADNVANSLYGTYLSDVARLGQARAQQNLEVGIERNCEPGGAFFSWYEDGAGSQQIFLSEPSPTFPTTGR